MDKANGEPVAQWMKPGQAAQHLQVTRRTIYRWMEQGSLPYHVLPSGRRRILKADLDALLMRGEPKPTTDK